MFLKSLGLVFQDRRSFWRDAITWQGSITPLAMPYVAAFGLIASAICALALVGEHLYQVKIALEMSPRWLDRMNRTKSQHQPTCLVSWR
jgi:hypothetical protein